MKGVLIIDDDQKIRKIIKRQLHRTEFNLHEAENRDIAFSILAETDIAVVICDIKMKDANGLVVLKELRTQYPGIPVIMLTGFIDKKVSDKAKTLGCFDFITKPVRREKLISTIRDALSGGDAS